MLPPMPLDLKLDGLTEDMQLVVKTLHRHLLAKTDNATRATDQLLATLDTAGIELAKGSWKTTKARRADDAIIVRKSEDKRLVFGWANVVATPDDEIVKDRQQDMILNSWELEKAAYNYMIRSRQAGEEHLQVGVGKAVESMVFTKDKMDQLGIPQGTLPVGWWIGFHVNDNDVWELVKSGDYSCFSVHGTGLRKKVAT